MTLKRSFLAVLFTVVSLGHGWGQATDANGQVISPIVFQSSEAITTTMVDPPVVGRDENPGGGSSNNNTQWLKIEFHYAVKPTAPLIFLDEVQFRIWVEGRDLYDPTEKTAEGVPVALTATVNYVNLAATRDAYGSFYIPPGALARYCTKNGISDFTEKFNVHVEAYVGGAKVDYFDKNKEPDLGWYKTLRVVDGMVCRQNQCPFLVSNTSLYPQIKLSTSGQ